MIEGSPGVVAKKRPGNLSITSLLMVKSTGL
jgi:hypothetical protein